MPTYVVRIYRRTGRRLTGIVENAETGACNAFRSTRELLRLLAAVPLEAARLADAGKQGAILTSQPGSQNKGDKP
jgi:hypothetical protein